jgi:hypothetical protein
MRHSDSHGPSGPPRSVFLPYPELVEQGPHDGVWEVEDSIGQTWLPSNGATNKVAKKIWVPLEPGGEGVTWHELGHVRFSPEKLPRVRFPLIFLQATEDARINMGLAVIGRPVVLDREQQAHVAHLAARDAKSGDIAATLVRAIASLGTSAAPTMRAELEALAPHVSDWAVAWLDRVELRLSRARGRVGGPVAPFYVAHQIAKELAKDLKRRGVAKDDFSVDGMVCCSVEGEGGHGHIEGRGMSKSAYARLVERRRRAGAAGVAVGRMKIALPPLVVRQPSVLRAGLARRRCAMEGTQIARPDRLALDRAIFHRGARGGGGTILVDTSGSMSLNAKHVEELVRSAGGAAVVAIYSGRGDQGELRIIARGDRRVAREFFEPFGSGNVVDLPALEWLAKQPAPRLWVSDGCVTGVGDEGCEQILEACHEVRRRAKILRVDSPKEAIGHLDGSITPGDSIA